MSIHRAWHPNLRLRILVPAFLVAAGLTLPVFLSKTDATAAATVAICVGLAAVGLVAILMTAGVTAASSVSTAAPNEVTGSSNMAGGALHNRDAHQEQVTLQPKDLALPDAQAQKMDALGRLAGGVAHDFNNMLTAILGYCELLIEDATISESHRADLKEIEKAGRAAEALTRQLLAFSRREVIEPVVVDLNEVLSGIDRLLPGPLGDGIRVESQLASDLDNIKADRGQLERMVLSLLMNARAAMVAGGRISLETQNVSLADGLTSPYLSAPPGRYVMMAVTDEGPGVSDDMLPHLFEPFFTTAGSGKGAGLGLATIYGIVKQNGGGIRVQSDRNRGRTFRIYLPSTNEEPTEGSGTGAAAGATTLKQTILVVEDDQGIRELTSRVLSRYGYSVLTASGGGDARTIGETHDGAIDLLLSDVVMPGMSGPQVAAMLKAMRPSIKVIYMSGYSDEAIVRHGVVAHETPFLQKPFTPERLHNKILEVLSN